jgi:hypothetical protein
VCGTEREKERATHRCMHECQVREGSIQLDADGVHFLLLLELIAHVSAVITSATKPMSKNGKVSPKLLEPEIELVGFVTGPTITVFTLLAPGIGASTRLSRSQHRSATCSERGSVCGRVGRESSECPPNPRVLPECARQAPHTKQRKHV